MTTSNSEFGSRSSICNDLMKEGTSPKERLKNLYFIFQVGSRIPLEDVTVCKACCYFHKFCQAEEKVLAQYDLYTVAAACLNLASKICDDPPASSCLRDIVNVSHRVLHPTRPPLQLDEDFYDLRDSVGSMELHLLRVIQFRTDFANSFKYLCHYLLSIKQWISAPSAPGGNGGSGGSDEEYHGGSLLLPLCLTLHRDMYLCPVVLQNEPQILALSAIYLAMALLDYELVGFETQKTPPKLNSEQTVSSSNLTGSHFQHKQNFPRKKWFQVFYGDATREVLESVCCEFMKLLNEKNSSFLDSLKKNYPEKSISSNT